MLLRNGTCLWSWTHFIFIVLIIWVTSKAFRFRFVICFNILVKIMNKLTIFLMNIFSTNTSEYLRTYLLKDLTFLIYDAWFMDTLRKMTLKINKERHTYNTLFLLLITTVLFFILRTLTYNVIYVLATTTFLNNTLIAILSPV